MEYPDKIYTSNKRFVAALKRKGINQRELADLMDLSTTSMSYKANGILPWTQAEIVYLKDLLNLTAIETVATFLTERTVEENKKSKGEMRHGVRVLPD